MTRTVAREIAVQLSFYMAVSGGGANVLDAFFEREYYDTLSREDELFAQYPDKKQMEYIRGLALGVFERRAELDGYIEKYSKGWKVERISKTAAAVLRCAMFEVLYMDDVPAAAAINEAVELSKGYEEPETVAFINGILGSFTRGETDFDAGTDTVQEPEAAEPSEEPGRIEPDNSAAPEAEARE